MEIEELLEWLNEYGIGEKEIRDRLIEEGYEGAVKFVLSYIGDSAYAEKIVSSFVY